MQQLQCAFHLHIFERLAQALLVKMAPLAGAWGIERYGFADAAVLAALEGLPGADACAEYVFVEERGPWEAEGQAPGE